MTEAEARAALRAFVGVGNVEPWIAGRPWQAAPGGWAVAGELQGWRFRLEVVPGGVRVVAAAARGPVGGVDRAGKAGATWRSASLLNGLVARRPASVPDPSAAPQPR
jgi:hypothetical protein